MGLHKRDIDGKAGAIFLESVGNAFACVLGNILWEVLEGTRTLVSGDGRAD